MSAIGVLLLAAATATSQLGGAHVGGKRLLRHHLVKDGPAPPGGMMAPGAAGCQFGHAGCGGGPSCPGGGGPGMGGPGMGGPGMGGPGGASNRRFPNTRSQVFFVDPTGMKIGWQTAAGGVERVYLPGQLTTPARYNFTQGYIYRLKLTDIPGRPNLQLYPSLEIAPSTPATDAYLTHNPIPAQFTDEDFDQIQAGNFVTKVIYLPDPRFQELAVAGVETLVSTRLEPGVDPILEADRRGTILMIIRIGAIDLEMPSAGASLPPGAAGAVTAPTIVPGSAPGTVLPPNSLPPGTGPFTPRVNPPAAPAPTDAVPVDSGAAPVTPVPPAAAPPVPAPAAPAAAPAPGDATPPPPPAENAAPAPGEPKPGEAPSLDLPRL